MKNIILLFATTFALSFTAESQPAQLIASNTLIPTEISNSIDKSNAKSIAIKTWKTVERQVIQKLLANLEYPTIAQDNGVEGSVVIKCMFDGTISNIEVVESVGAGCDKAALAALENLPRYYKELGGTVLSPIDLNIPFKFFIQ